MMTTRHHLAQLKPESEIVLIPKIGGG